MLSSLTKTFRYPFLQRLDIRGKIKVLHGQNKKAEDAPLALFCLCTPFGPPSLLEIPHKEVMFKSKHKLDFSFVSMDQRYYTYNATKCFIGLYVLIALNNDMRSTYFS